MTLIPKTALRSANNPTFAEELNRTISNLENLSAADFNAIFSSYIRGANSLRRSKGLADLDFAAELVARVAQLRNGVTVWLKNQSVDSHTLTLLERPTEGLPKPDIRLPKAALSFEQVPSALASPIQALWSYYFQDFWKVRAHAEQVWQREIGQADPIAELSRAAKRETAIFNVGHAHGACSAIFTERVQQKTIGN